MITELHLFRHFYSLIFKSLFMESKSEMASKAQRRLRDMYSSEERMELNLRALLNLVNNQELDQETKDAAYFYYLNCLREL